MFVTDNGSEVDMVDGVVLRGPVLAGAEDILSPQALAFTRAAASGDRARCPARVVVHWSPWGVSHGSSSA